MIILFINASFAAVLGDFRSQKILTGFYTFDKYSAYYKVIMNDKFDLKNFKSLEDQIDNFYFQTQKYFCVDNLRKKIESYDDCSSEALSSKSSADFYGDDLIESISKFFYSQYSAF